MAVFKIVPEAYDNPEVIDTILNYILNPQKCLNSDTRFLFPDEQISILRNQFVYFKQYYGKTNYKQIEHFILSIDSNLEESDISAGHLIRCATDILHFNLKGYQAVYALHRNHAGLHIHIIINTVQPFSGEMFRLNKSNFHSFMYEIAETLGALHIALEGYTYYDERGRLRKGKSPEGFLYLNKFPKYI